MPLSRIVCSINKDVYMKPLSGYFQQYYPIFSEDQKLFHKYNAKLVFVMKPDHTNIEDGVAKCDLQYREIHLVIELLIEHEICSYNDETLGTI